MGTYCIRVVRVCRILRAVVLLGKLQKMEVDIASNVWRIV